MEHVYLSYSGRNCEGVLQVMEAIIRQGYALACDCMLPAHEDFDVRVSRAMKNAKAFVAVMTEDAADCQFMKKELRMAVEEGLRIVPVLVGTATVPKEYESMQWEITHLSDYPTAEEIAAVMHRIG